MLLLELNGLLLCYRYIFVMFDLIVCYYDFIVSTVAISQVIAWKDSSQR